MGLLATAAVADMPVGAPPPFASALEPGSRPHADKRGTVIARALSGLAAMLPRVSADQLSALAAEETDYGVLAALCQAPATLDAWQHSDPFAAARQRATEVKQRLIEVEGGVEPVSAL